MYCSQSCASSSECSGSQCMKTQYAGLLVCGKPGTTTPTDPGATSPPTDPTTPPSQPPPSEPTPPSQPTPPADTTPPQVAITSPAALARVATSFTVVATVTDESGVSKAELRVDEAVMASRTGGPYEFPVIVSKAGEHLVRVTAYDPQGNKGEATVSITVDAPASPGASTPAPTKPTQPAAPLPSGKGGYADPCLGPKDCATGLCAFDPALVRQFCTRSCQSQACPVGSECLPAGPGQQVCAPSLGGKQASGAASDGQAIPAMSCSAGGGTSAPWGSGLLLLALLVLRVRSRRRPS